MYHHVTASYFVCIITSVIFAKRIFPPQEQTTSKNVYLWLTAPNTLPKYLRQGFNKHWLTVLGLGNADVNVFHRLPKINSLFKDEDSYASKFQKKLLTEIVQIINNVTIKTVSELAKELSIFKKSDKFNHTLRREDKLTQWQNV